MCIIAWKEMEDYLGLWEDKIGHHQWTIVGLGWLQTNAIKYSETYNSLSGMRCQYLVHLMSILETILCDNGILEKSNKQWRSRRSVYITELSFLTDILLSLDLTILIFCGQIIYCINLIDGNWGGKWIIFLRKYPGSFFVSYLVMHWSIWKNQNSRSSNSNNNDEDDYDNNKSNSKDIHETLCLVYVLQHSQLCDRLIYR